MEGRSPVSSSSRFIISSDDVGCGFSSVGLSFDERGAPALIRDYRQPSRVAECDPPWCRPATIEGAGDCPGAGIQQLNESRTLVAGDTDVDLRAIGRDRQTKRSAYAGTRPRWNRRLVHVRDDIIDVDVSIAGFVGDVELAPVRGEREALRLSSHDEDPRLLLLGEIDLGDCAAGK